MSFHHQPGLPENTYLIRLLVRDNDVDAMEADGARCEFHDSDNNDQIGQLLDAKLLLEAKEVGTAPPDKLISELADMLTLVYARAEIAGIDRTTLHVFEEQKTRERGTFKRGRLVSRVTCPVGSKWDRHFAAQPNRYDADHKRPVPLKPAPAKTPEA